MRKKCITPLIWDKKTCGLALPKVPIIMKSLFYACLLSSAGLTYASNSYAQTTMVSINVENQTVKEVLDEIENTTEYSFFYNTRHVDLDRKVSVNINNADIFEVLDDVFSGTNVVYSVKDRSIILSVKEISPVIAQNDNKITGTIVDASGIPVIGANVMVKGTSNGTITDMDGRFTLDVPKDAVLEVSYIGYSTQTVKVGGQKSLSITLREDTQKLDEVVVVGYGSLNRKNVTSSITTIKSKDLNVGVYTDPGQMLQGKVPGLNIVQSSDPNSSVSSILLRGASTFRNEASSPYYVIDGVPGMDLSLISPDDIESIDVLRDATATAIYGSKAANGVIVVTTKKGKSGTTNINYSGYVAFDHMLKGLDMMSANELRDYAKNNNLSLNNDEGASTNWSDEVIRTAISHNHNLSISGGNDKSKYSASFNYIEKEGIITGTDMDRINARTFVETKGLNDRLNVSINLNASVTNSNKVSTGSKGQSVYHSIYSYTPLAPVKNDDGSWYENSTVSQNFNPVSMINEDLLNEQTKDLQGTAKASLDIMDGLVYNVIYSYSNKQLNKNTYHSTNSQIDKHNGSATRASYESKRSVFETYFNYDKTFNKVHKLGLMAGYSWEESNNKNGFELTVKDFYNDDLSYYNLGAGNKVELSDIPFSEYNALRMISFYGRVNYAFNSKYMLQATVRRDGSSAFGKNNRWATFPSASLAWRLSEEGFIKNLNIFDDLKFRVGYGVSGNSFGFDAFSAIQTYGPSGFFTYTDPKGISSIYRTLSALRNNNPDLKWESTSMFNVGLDYSFFGGRLNGTIEYYDKETSDLIYDYPVSTNRYQYQFMAANVGDISNKGIEISINAIPVKTSNFQWETSLNISHNKNVVEKLSNDIYSVKYIEPDASDPYISGFSGAKTQRIMEGYPIGTFYMWEWAGYNEQGISVFVDRDSDGNVVGTTMTPEDHDRTVVGNAQPKVNFGWNNTLTWKKWSLTAFMQGVLGNKIFNATKAYFSNVGNVEFGYNILKDVPTEQKTTDIVAQAPSDRYLENGSYLRLSQLTLGYNFGNIGNWVKNVNLYATCNNVFTITGYSGRDPEINLGGLTPGIDNRDIYYPRTRSFLLGLKVNF